MAVRTEELFRTGYFQGLQPGGDAWLRFIFEPKNCRFLPRAAAEDDPSWKQIIPYVVLTCGDQVFGYRRGQRSSESRLRALGSIGLGGHIRAQDETLFAAPGWPAYQAALERELSEEVALQGDVIDDRLVGLINDDSVEVGRFHIGLVHVRRLGQPLAKARESKIAAAHFAPVDEWRQGRGWELETWSQLCLDHWPAIASRPGWLP